MKNLINTVLFSDTIENKKNILNVLRSKKNLNEKIFIVARNLGYEPHSIINNCVLQLSNGNYFNANSKRELLNNLLNN